MKKNMNEIKLTFFAVKVVTDRMGLNSLKGESLCISSTFLLPLLSPRFPLSSLPLFNQVITLCVYRMPLSLRGLEIDWCLYIRKTISVDGCHEYN